MPDKLIPGEKKTPVYKRSGFKLKSGNNMAGSSFKMMGSSSPLHVEEEVVEGGTLPTVEVSGGESREKGSEKFTRVKAETDILKGNLKGKLTNLSKEYGGTWTTEDRSGKGGSKTTFVNEEGLTAKQVAIQQSQEYHKRKREYEEGA